MKTKTHLNLGNAFVDTYGSRIVCLQLIPAGKHAAIADATFTRGALVRCYATKEADKTAFLADCYEIASESAVKSLEWAYPTSPNAEAHGFKDSGCWVINLGLPDKPHHAVRAFPEDQKAYALHCAQILPFPWSNIALRIHPEYAQPVNSPADAGSLTDIQS